MTQLHLDLQAPTSRLDAVWAFGGRAGDAALLLRKDLRQHLLMCRDELGFRHVRCEGILSREMVAAKADGSLDFDKVDAVLDWMLQNGLVPFFALGTACAGRGKARPAGESAPSAPWQDGVGALAAHVDGRYGCDAREWHFEICAEPGAAGVAAPKAYDLAARAIREVHLEYRVGGPAARDGAGLDAFLAHATGAAAAAEGADRPEGFSPDVLRCDFVTAAVGEGGFTAADVRRKVTAALGPHVPLIVSEANLREGDTFRPDECGHAARVVRRAVEGVGDCQGNVYADASDIGDEPGRGFEPFHGGSGLITVNDIRKAAFHGLRLLHEHAGYHCERVPERWTDPAAGLGCLATRSENTLRLLLWLDREPAAAGGSGSTAPVRFTVEGLADSVRTAQVEVIRPGAGSAFEAWMASGRPPFVNRNVLDILEVASQPATAQVDFREYPPRLEPGMVMQLTMHLPFGEGDEIAMRHPASLRLRRELELPGS